MLPYIVILTTIGAAAFATIRKSKLLLIATLIVYIVMIGFRFQIGVDWNNYIYQYRLNSVRPIEDILWLTTMASKTLGRWYNPR